MIYPEEFALDTEDFPYEASREEMKIEAMERMELLGLSERTIRKFMDDGTIYESLPIACDSKPLSDERLVQVRKFEEHHNALVYFAVRSLLRVDGQKAELASHLFVSKETAEWPMERAMIRKGMCCYIFSYVIGHPDQIAIDEVQIKQLWNK